MTNECGDGSVVVGPEETLAVVSWTGGVWDFEWPPLCGPADVRLCITSGADGQEALSAEMTTLMVPVFSRVDVLRMGEREVQSFRYNTCLGWSVDWGYCGNCGWSCPNVLLHIKAKKAACGKCGGEVSWRRCLRHHTFGECSLCALPTMPAV